MGFFEDNYCELCGRECYRMKDNKKTSPESGYENVCDYLIGDNLYSVICMKCVKGIENRDDWVERKEEVHVEEYDIKWL